MKFCDVGGCEDTLREVSKLLVHLLHPKVFSQLGVHPPQGFLLHGPPGCGKTLLAHAVAGVSVVDRKEGRGLGLCRMGEKGEGAGQGGGV